MVVTESQVNNIMGGMENTAGVRLHSHRHKLKQRFDILRKLGQGTYGKVQLAVNKETSQEVAIKTIKKAKIETEQDLIRIRREIQIMSSVQHPQIIHIYEVFENREKMVLVMEYAAGGELYDYLSDRKVLNEEEARRVFRQVASAVYYCHKHKICHRDLKLENILLDLEGNAKIADFGLSNVFGDKRRLDTFCGSPLYASPEIVKGIPYAGPEVDCWSLGVLLYTLVYGAMPFDGSNFKRLVKQITMGDYYEPKKPSRASDLIRHMLTVSAAKRASIEDICSHWWVNEGYMESCLEVAEFLANQTPVRLDLLLSLVPKHINSEHMLIQPDEDDSSQQTQVNANSQGAPQLELPPPPPLPSDNELVPDVPARSHSMGAMANIDQSEFEALLELKRQEKREKEEDEKKRKREGSSTAERKKKKDAASEGTPKPRRKESSAAKEEDSSHAATMDTDVSECSEATPSVRRKGSKKPPTGPAGSDSLDRKKSTRRKDSVNEGRDHSEKSERRKSIKKREPSMEVDVNDVSERSERRKSLKKKESSVDRDVSESEKSERRKSVKKRDTSTSRDSSANAEKTEKKRSLKQKEKDVEKTDSVTQNDTSIEPSSVISVDKPVNKPDSLVNDKEISESLHEAQVIAPAAVAAPLPTPSSEMVRKPPLPREVQEKIRSSSEDSRPQPKEDEVARLGKSSEQEVVTKSKGEGESKKIIDKSSSGKSLLSLTSNEGTLKASDSSISRAGSVSPVKTVGEDSGISSLSSHVKKEKSKSKSPAPKVSIEVPKASRIQDTSSPETTGVLGTPQSPLLPPDTDKILQETASKIKETEGYSTPVKAKSPEVKSGDIRSESTSSKDSSRQSSLTSTPARSRTGSESSTDAPGRRQSKIFSKAAMWDNMMSQGTKEKTPTTDKPKKVGRPGGPNMADLTKKFEDKSAPERKSVILPAFKISDARKAFESKPAEKPNFPRKKSVDSTPSSPTTKEIPKLDHTSSGKLKDKVKETSVLKNGSSKDLKSVSRKNSLTEKSPAKDVKDKLSKKESPKENTPTRSSSSKIQPEEKAELPNQVIKAATDDKMVKPKTQTKTLEVKEREIITSSEEDEAVVVGGLNLKLGGVGKIAEVGTKQEIKRTDSSDSSDSESEAEKLLKLLSEKREKVEAAKREKLRKVSQRSGGAEKDMPAISEESKSPSVSPSKSPEKTRKVSPVKESKESPEQKYATLPKGFKNKSKISNGEVRGIGSGSSTEKMERDALISQEIEGMMSAIKAVDRALTQEEQEIQLLKDSLVKTLPDGGKTSVTNSRTSSKEKLYSPRADRRTPGKEVQVIPPSQVLSPTPRDKEDTSQRQWGSARKETPSSGTQQSTPTVSSKATPISSVSSDHHIHKTRVTQIPGEDVEKQKDSDGTTPTRKKAQMEIILNNRPDDTKKRSSYAEIQLSSPTTKEQPKHEYKTEKDHPSRSSKPLGEPQLQRARRERIIPIMLEDDDDDDRSLSESQPPPNTPSSARQMVSPDRGGMGGGSSSSLGGGGVRGLSSPLSSMSSTSHTKASIPSEPSSQHTSRTVSPEPIKKSRRERIIPISVEGEGIVTPPSSVAASLGEVGADLGTARAHEAFQRNLGTSGRNKTFSDASPAEVEGVAQGRGGGGEEGGRREDQPSALSPASSQTTTSSSSMNSHPYHHQPRTDTASHTPVVPHKRSSSSNRTRGFSMLDRSESFSSAGEDEEDEDDGFQILTAESLFSTLLNRVRNLTRKMNVDDRPERKRSSHQTTPEPAMSPPPHSAGGASGFWSSLYSSPRDSPARRISETLSRSFSREDDGGVGGMTSPAWSHRSVSRDPSDADTVFSDSSTPFSTLPRGWRSRISGGEDGAESDTSEASSRSLPRRAPPYSRGPSRDLHNIPDDPAEEDAARTNTSMTYPRPYMGSSSTSAEDHRQTTAGGFSSRPLRPADQERIAMYGTLRGRGERRPHSAMVSDSYREAPDTSGLRRGGPSGEASGRDGGHSEQQQKIAAPNIKQQRNQTSPSSGSSQLKKGVDSSVATNVPSREQMSSESFRNTDVPAVHLKEASPVQPEVQSPKPSVQDQIRQLVKELEEVPYDEDQLQVNKESKSGPTASTVSPPCTTASSQVFRSSSTSGSNVLKKSIRKDPRLTNSSTSISVTLVKPQVPVIHKPTGLQGGLAKNSSPSTTSRTNTSASKDPLPKKLSMPGIHLKEYSKETPSSQAVKNKDFVSKSQTPVTNSESSSHTSKINKEISSPKREFSPTVSFQQEPLTESINDKSNVETKPELTGTVVGYPNNKIRNSNNTLDVVKFDDASSVASSTDTSLSRESRTSSALTDATTVSRDSRSSSVALTEPKPTDSIRRASTTNEIAYRAGSVVRSADSSALDAYRRSKSRGELATRSAYSTLEKPTGPEPYRRGKSEDLRHAIDTINKLETPFQRYKKSKSRDLERSIEATNRVSTDLLSPTSAHPYQRSKSRELTPAIEAAGEKFNQLNSGTLRRISPFEAYRRSKSRELGSAIDMVANRELEKVRSTPSTLERAKSPFERAKTSIERRFDRAMSPMRSKSPLVERSKTMEHTKSPLVTKECKANGDVESGTLPPKSPQASNDRKLFSSVEPENDQEEGEKKKKTSAGDLEKPKSMYKLITSKFSKSQSSLPDVSKDKKNEEDDDKDDKFKLKRPSRFLKQKTEKSHSRTSIASAIEEPTKSEDKVDESDRGDRKPSKKISHALNKFLGRKDSKGEDGKSDSTHLASSTSSVPSVGATCNTDEEKTKKAPRFKIKRFSKSQENLNQQVEEEESKMAPVERSMSEAPKVKVVNRNPDPNVKSIMKKKSGDGPVPHSPEITIESVTKSLCDHLTQLESNITSRIGNIPTQSSASTTAIHKPTMNMATHSKSSGSISSQISTYGLSPALASRRGARPSNLGLVSSGIDNVKNLDDKIAKEDKENTPDVNVETGDNVKYAKIKRLDTIDDTEEGRHTPTECESVSSEGLDDRGNASATEDESVMERITRKSFYSRFQDPKKQKARRINTKESIDQQLAMAKARLMKEDEEFARTASHEPSRVTSPVSPRTSQTSVYDSSIPRRSSRKSSGPRTTSMPPEDLLSIGKQSSRSSSLQPEELKNRRMPSLPPEDRHRHSSSIRSPSMPRDIGYPSPFRSPSVPPEDLKFRERRILSVAEEPDDRGDESTPPSKAVAAAVAAGKAAGLAAAEEKEPKQIRSRDTSLARLTSPEPKPGRQSHSMRASSQDPINTAREELSRRLTPLTRIGNQTSRASDGLGQRSYRRTVTTGRLGDLTPSITPAPPSKTVIERPAYRRTNTMDLPPSEALGRTGSEYRRFTQDPIRRYSAARTPGTDNFNNTSSCSTNNSYSHRDLTASNSPTSPSSAHSPTSTLLRSRLSSLYDQSSSPTSPTSRLTGSYSHSSPTSLSRRISFYRY